MDDKHLIGVRIRDLRNAKGMTQDQLSESANINSKFLSSIERGQENPTLNTILKLAVSLDVSLEDIFVGIEIEDPKNRKPMIDALLKRADDEQLKLAYQILSLVIK